MPASLKFVGIGACSFAGISMVIASAVMGASPRLVYNASDSAPRGLYVVDRLTEVHVGDYVVARLPEASATFAAQRGYLPRTVPVLKRVAAVGGQQVCVRNGWVYIDAAAVAKTLAYDAHRRTLHAWDQCRRLMPQELFLLNAGNPASFDSRYFGPVDVSFVRGRATKW